MKFLSSLRIIIAAISLSVFIFNFIHSEVGFLKHQEEIDCCVDFCKIIDGSGNPSVNKSTSSFYKIKVDFILTDKIIFGTPREVSFLSDTNTFLYIQKTNKVYLHNNSFLI